MKIDWLHKDGYSRLILIFAGWSTDASFYSDIIHEGWDIAVVSGYSDLSFPSHVTEGYSSVAVIAWSLGVWAASRALSGDNIALAIAVNGTECPVNDSFGIPVAVFDGTTENLSVRNLDRFRRRIAGKGYDSIKDRLQNCRTDIGDLRKELEFIRKCCKETHKTSLRWQRAYISSDDLIFPASSQLSAWEQNPFHPETVVVEGAHYIDLAQVIKGALPTEKKIGERFRKAVPTYDSQAYAQRRIAERLAGICDDSVIGKMIEIGSGTGIFSRIIAEKCHPSAMTFVDLYELEPYGVANREEYIVADAENWMTLEADMHPASADAIVSASAIQWFVNPRSFIHNAAKVLKPGGILLCSTFLPGNLAELKNVAPFGLVYRSRDELERYLRECFSDVVMEESELPVTFDSARETLLHLRHTGVGGGASSAHDLRQLLSLLSPHLTYRPLFIRAKL